MSLVQNWFSAFCLLVCLQIECAGLGFDLWLLLGFRVVARFLRVAARVLGVAARVLGADARVLGFLFGF